MTYVIAEIGLNADNDVDLAKKYIKTAKQCGADCVKFQAYQPLSLCDPMYQEDFYRQLLDCQFSYNDFYVLHKHCIDLGIDFLCTPDDIESASFLNGFVDKFKISSIGAANWHLLRLINCFKKPVYISNGILNQPGIEAANDLLKNCEVTWFDCVSKYPAEEEDYIDKMAKTGRPRGISDHTLGVETAISAARMGVKYIEKHFTLDKNADGFDHHMSINPDELKQLCKAVK